VEILKMAAPLHDIGKVGIPETILNNPGPLNSEQVKLMQEHTSIGYEMLCHSEREIMRAAATIAHEHHERWDGQGYPQGKRGEEIHPFGRIVAVCDVFDALSHKRVYKGPWTLDDAIQHIRDGRGSSFDPLVVDTFLANLEEILSINEEYRD